MRAAEESPADLYAMPDHLATAVLANRRQGLNCTLKAVEGMLRTRRPDLKALVILVPANFALGHSEFS